MVSLWPWIVIACGLIFLFGYRFYGTHYIAQRPRIPFRDSIKDMLALQVRDARDWMPVIVSLLVLLTALYVILSNDRSGDAQKWAFGAVGMILGHWLKR
jgi:carbon starvation protein CstA